jgi:LysM repeat protein
MFRRTLAVPLLVPAIAGTALAQTTDTAPAPSNASEVHLPPPPPPQPGIPGQLQPDGNYTVKQGDTLWDLSQQFLQNPWYWPKIWADNKEIENPHWIYPGNRLKIRRAGPGEPGEIGPADEDDNDAEETGYAEPKKAEVPDFSMGTLKAGSFTEGSDDVSVGGSMPIGLRPPSGNIRVRIASIITQNELQDSGTLTHSFVEKTMMGQWDKVYAKFPNLNDVQLGATYTVFRTDDKVVTHPITKQKFGYQARLLGTVKVVGKNEKEAICEIGPIFDDVERGDHLALNTALEKTVHVTPNESDVNGVVLISDISGMVLPGQNHAVFIDKGSADGVKDGNTFTVVETGDGLGFLKLTGELDKQDPVVREDIATLVVFNVGEHSSEAMVVKSLREIMIGDRVEMRRSPALAASAAP